MKELDEIFDGKDRQIVYLIARGQTNACIARSMSISIHTLKSRVQRLLNLTKAVNRTHLIYILVSAGYIPKAKV